MRTSPRLVAITFAFTLSLFLSSCAVRRANLVTTGNNSTTSATCTTNVQATLSRLNSGDAKVGETVFFRLEASGCSGQYTFSSQGVSFSQSAPFFYSHTYSSAQSVIETVQVQDANFPTQTATAVVNFNVVNASVGSISCTATILPASAVLDPTTNKAAVVATVGGTGTSSYKISAYRYLSGGGSSLSTLTPVPSAVGANLGLSLNLSAAGQHMFAFDIQDSANPSLVATCNADVQVVEDGTLSFSGAMEQFGNSVVATSPVTRSIAATNAGTTNMALQAAVLTGASDFSLVSDGCVGSLAAGASCTVQVKFTPSGAGMKNGSLSISYTSASQTVKNAVLSLQGSSPSSASISMSSSSTGLNFGSVVPGAQSASFPVTITGLGPGAARLKGIEISNAVFVSLNNNCPWYTTNSATLAANATCTLNFAFQPSISGTYSATMTLAYEDEAGTCFTSTMSFTGVAPGSSDTVSLGQHFACAIRSGGAYCWGLNNNGNLGDNSTTDRVNATAVRDLDSGVTSIATGLAHACAIQNGALKCWGYNNFGSIGDNTTADRWIPTAVSGMSSGVTAVAAGGNSTCAIQNGALKCWGVNGFGQLGDGTKVDHKIPMAVSGLTSGVTAISMSNEPGANSGTTTCAIHNGAAKCWGYNNFFNVGDGSTTARLAPYALSSYASGVTSIMAFNGRTCLIQNGGMKCWGNGRKGELGNGTDGVSAVYSSAVTPTGMDTGITSIGGGHEHTCAIKTGKLYCWGSNSVGNVGDGSTAKRTVPTMVLGMESNVEKVAREGFNSSCAVKNSKLYCWGQNNRYQLGDGTNIDRSAPGLVFGW